MPTFRTRSSRLACSTGTGNRAIEYAILSRTTLAAPARPDDCYLMTPKISSRVHPSKAQWLVVLRRVVFGFAVLASAAETAVLGYAAFFFVWGYSGGSDPASPDPLLIPFAILVVLVAGLPIALVCAVTWAGYFAMARRRTRTMTST